ncbi:chitobiosyldiphosphodolichol beta-mannosyltransferase isoform X1 [Anopheles ziemanni]|uniref:chitobiosyldiphosphodolichol beta-mannosyltransferase isoform X1 n=1 Tax=Anopheles coustani TaxID=139045 RepID=UPI00265B3ACB|nr:chitobiosyldiphosphodolichol beta-mannosyltransferase isoform X1 [Anopheles coustani]XP_058172621.1 chitobiosyldiphosphodolichol beta-mannosyltransferase isoform X1 [Anopheles ziemanni]
MSLERKVQNACVIVLGDIGRSPRMQYHVKSLSENDFSVDFIGYVQSTPLEEIRRSPNVRIHALNPFPELELPNILKYLFKTVWQALGLLITLISIQKPKFILCQNPPAIPAVIVAYLYCLLARSKLIIDWHNYTYSILAIESPNSPVVRFAKQIEAFFGARATNSFCVTKAMKENLQAEWNIRATVLYDRPPQQFQSISVVEKHNLFLRLGESIAAFRPASASQAVAEEIIESTAFTVKDRNGNVKLLDSRPAVLISSTSWTPDEDFSLLISALDHYERVATEQPLHYPRLVCIITGKGPLKEKFSKIIESKPWQKVTVHMPWLENEDYPKLLASSDLGVCLHYSSSGLDLPMKVVDMFGSGLPVCAVDFDCIEELVKHEQNGFIFRDHQELADQIVHWFYDFPNNIALSNTKQNIQKHLKEFQSLRWTENWKNVALPIFRE